MSLKSFYKKGVIEAGCDEAGRGCLAGPVFAAAVILPSDFSHPFLNDSKKLTEKQRYELRIVIEKQSVSFAVAYCDNLIVDDINILNASILSMHKALNKLNVIPKHIIVDGNRFHRYKEVRHQCIVKGDSKYFSIAAASVLAKTYRDEYMQVLHKEFPQYSWNTNKAYPTKLHREAIVNFGISKYHRKTFRLIEGQV